MAEAAAGPPMKLVQDDEGACPAIIHTGATTTPADSPAGKNPAAAGSGRPTPAKKAPERKPRKTRRQGLGPYRLLQPWQKEKLDAFFKDCPLPSTEQKGKLAKDMDMDVAHLQTWFINRRTKQRRLSERMSARHAATKVGAPGGVAGGGGMRKGKGKDKGKGKGKGKDKGKGKGKGPAAAVAAAAVAAMVAAGGIKQGGQGGSGSRGATENASPDATTHGVLPGPTAVHPAALQVAAAAHPWMVHAAQLAHLPGVAAQQTAAVAAAGVGAGGKGGEDVEVQSTQATLVPIGVPPFLGGGAAPGAMPGLPGGLPYPGAVRDFFLPGLPAGAAWGMPGAAIAPPAAAAVHDGGVGGAVPGSMEAAAAAAQWSLGGAGGGTGYAPGLSNVQSWGHLQMFPGQPPQGPTHVYPAHVVGAHPGPPGMPHVSSVPQLAPRKLQLLPGDPSAGPAAPAGVGGPTPLAGFISELERDMTMPRV